MWNYCFVRDIISWDTELSSFTEGHEVPYKLYLKNSRISLVVLLQDYYFKPFMSFHVILHEVSFLWPPTNILCNFFTVLFTSGAVNRSS